MNGIFQSRSSFPAAFPKDSKKRTKKELKKANISCFNDEPQPLGFHGAKSSKYRRSASEQTIIAPDWNSGDNYLVNTFLTI